MLNWDCNIGVPPRLVKGTNGLELSKALTRPVVNLIVKGSTHLKSFAKKVLNLELGTQEFNKEIVAPLLNISRKLTD